MFRKGYTTVELLTVISTIAVLASAMLPVYQVSVDQAKDLKVQVEKKYISYGGYSYMK